MAFMAMLPSLLGAAAGAVKGVGIGVKRRGRRRRTRLSAREMAELSFIKNTLGKTAAAAAMPFYLGRGG